MKKVKTCLFFALIIGILVAMPNFVPMARAASLTQSQIDAIVSLLQSFGADQTVISNVQTALGGTPTVPAITVWCHDFNVNLEIDDNGSEVAALQTALGKENFNIANYQNGNFNEGTASTVTGFQQKYADEILTPLGLKYGTGYVGKATRAKLNKLYGCTTAISPDVWNFVFTHRGTPLPDDAFNFLCTTVKSSISAWVNREAIKYNQLKPFSDINCLRTQVQLSGDLLVGEPFNIEGQTFTGPLNSTLVINYLETQVPSLKDAKFVTIFHYIPTDFQFANYDYSSKYDFIFIKSPNSAIPYYPPLEVNAYAETISHEFMHKLGAIDKYGSTPTIACLTNPQTNQPYSGYDIMCHRILSPNGEITTPNFDQLIVSDATALEIGWIKQAIAVLSPNGRENWEQGVNHLISWKGGTCPATNPHECVIVSLRRIVGTTSYHVGWLGIGGAPNGSLNWDGKLFCDSLPLATAKCSSVVPGTYQIMVSDGIDTDASDAAFSIAASGVSIKNSQFEQVASILQSVKSAINELMRFTK